MNMHSKFYRVCCPVCGGDIGEAPELEAIRSKIRQPSQRLIFDMLAKIPGNPVDRDDIFARLYSHRRDGGPERGQRSIHVFVSSLRKQLQLFGWTVSSSIGGRGYTSHYRLIPLEAGA